MQPQARIHIGVRHANREDVVFARDKGVGFDMRARERLFTTFGHPHRAQDFDGVGLVLTLVKRLVTRQGGRVWAEGRPTFWLALPASTPEG